MLNFAPWNPNLQIVSSQRPLNPVFDKLALNIFHFVFVEDAKFQEWCI